MPLHRRAPRYAGSPFAIVLVVIFMVLLATQALRAMQRLLVPTPGEQLIVDCETVPTGQISSSQAIPECAASSLKSAHDPTFLPLMVFSAEIVSQAIAWQRWEQRLKASGNYSNPYADVTLRVTYRGPDGTTLSSYGFWDGEHSFVIRAKFPSPGNWLWQTVSEPYDSGLSQQGSVTVAPGSSANPLYTHGRLTVSPNGRFLTHADSTPFFWLGDTAWDAPMKASEAEWHHYIDTRAAQGFSVVQIAPAASWWVQTDAQGQPPFIGQGITQWNPAYWQGFEQKIQAANERGLVVALFGVQDPIDDTWPSEQDARRFARQIVARLYGNHVIFAPSFDKPYSELSDAVGAEIRAATSIHLITQHPATTSGEPTNIWAEQYFNQSYLDIAGVQTGHNDGDRALVLGQALAWPLRLYERQPAKPVLNLEAFYDANGTRDGSGAFSGTAHDVRATAYLSWLSGSLGYTYGARGLMVWESDWQAALNYPSAGHMGVLKEVLGSLAWWGLRPAPERIQNQGIGMATMALAVSADERLVVAYLPGNEAIQIVMDGLVGPLRATWVDPLTGTRQDAGQVSATGTGTFARPGPGDWLLMLETL